MAKPKTSYESLSTAEKTEVKKRKIAKLFRELPAEKKQFADGLIYQFAVTTVTLERLVDEINAGDLIEDFVQGAQKLRRENPALKSYNATIKSFTALSKSLLDLLPEKTQKQAGEELMNFATKPPGAGRKRTMSLPIGRLSRAGRPSQAAASGPFTSASPGRYRSRTRIPRIISTRRSGSARLYSPNGFASSPRA